MKADVFDLSEKAKEHTAEFAKVTLDRERLEKMATSLEEKATIIELKKTIAQLGKQTCFQSFICRGGKESADQGL